MTSISDARQAVYDRVAEQFTGRVFTFANEDFAPTPGTAFTRFAVVHTGREQETLGRDGLRRFNSFATLVAQVFVPKDTGLALSDAIVDEIVAIFEAVSFDGLRFFSSSAPREIGVDGDWHQTNVDFNFDYEERK